MKFFSVSDQFEKNTQLKKEDFIQIKEWISKQPHLPQVTGKYMSIKLSQYNNILIK